MPRVSSAPEDALHYKGTYADGWGEVTDAKAVVFQYPPNKETGRQDPPDLFAELTIQRLVDKNGTKAAAAEETVLMKIQGHSKATGGLDLCHPGKFPDGNVDAEPTDCGADLGAEGDTLYAVSDGYQINDKVKYMRFTQSLVEKGFKPSVLKRTYFPDLIGLRAFFTTVVEKKVREDMSDASVFLVKEISQFPYEQKGNGAAAPKTPAAKAPKAPKNAAAPSAPSAPAAPPAAPAGNAASPDVSIEDLATAVITDTLAPAQSGQTVTDVKKLKVMAFMAINKHKPAILPELKKSVQQQIGDEEWLVSIGEASGLFTVLETGQVQFS